MEREKQATRKPERRLLSFGQIVIYIIYGFMVIAETLLAFRFALLLLGASPDAAFTEWIYNSSDVVLAPFRGIFPAREISEVSILDFSTLFAMIVYLLISYWLSNLIKKWEEKKRITR